MKPGKVTVQGLDLLMHQHNETDTERKLHNLINKYREAFVVLEDAARWYAGSLEPEVAEQALRKLQEMRG